MRTYKLGDVVQIKAHVQVGPWPVGGFVASVAEVFSTDANTGLWLERDRSDFPILLNAKDVTFIRSTAESERTTK